MEQLLHSTGHQKRDGNLIMIPQKLKHAGDERFVDILWQGYKMDANIPKESVHTMTPFTLAMY